MGLGGGNEKRGVSARKMNYLKTSQKKERNETRKKRTKRKERFETKVVNTKKKIPFIVR